MTSLTNTKRHITGKRRWQALVLAAVVLAGGSISAPQAADAAPLTTRSAECGIWQGYCAVKVKMTKTGASARSLYLKTSGFGKYSYSVYTSSGKVYCTGKIQGGWGAWKRCVVPNRSATLYVAVSHGEPVMKQVEVKLY